MVGPNGAGKTTLLARARRHRRRPPAPCGSTGQDWTGSRRTGGEVGLVHQDHALFPHLSALENVAFGPRARGVAAAPAREHAQACWTGWRRRPGLRRPGQLSGGQSQRVARGPGPGHRAPAAAARRALRRARRRGGPGACARSWPRTWPTSTGSRCSSPTTRSTCSPSPAGWWCSRTAGSPRARPPPRPPRAPATAHAARLLGRNVLRGTAHGTDVLLADGEPLVAAHPASRPGARTFSPTAVTLTGSEPTGSARNRWHAEVRRVVPTGDAAPGAARAAPTGRRPHSCGRRRARPRAGQPGLGERQGHRGDRDRCRRWVRHGSQPDLAVVEERAPARVSKPPPCRLDRQLANPACTWSWWVASLKNWLPVPVSR